jgi:transposase
MARKSKAVSEELYIKAREELCLLGKQAVISNKLQAIISVKKHGVKAVADFFGTTRQTIMTWINNFKAESSDGLKIQVGRGRKHLINNEIEQAICQFMQKNPNTTINGLCKFIMEKQNIVISKSTAHRLMQKIGLSYITPRPRHYKSEQSLQDDFKKNSRKSRKNTQKKR